MAQPYRHDPGLDPALSRLPRDGGLLPLDHCLGYLKRAPRGTYEDSIWEHLAGTASDPLSAGEHGKVAVKVIDDRGNELMAVKSLDEAEPER